MIGSVTIHVQWLRTGMAGSVAHILKVSCGCTSGSPLSPLPLNCSNYIGPSSTPGFFPLTSPLMVKTAIRMHTHMGLFTGPLTACLLTSESSCHGSNHGLLCLYAVLLGWHLVKEVASVEN